MPALYGAAFIISVEIIFLLLDGDIFTEFPLPVLSEHSRHAGTWTSLGEEERTTLLSASLTLCACCLRQHSQLCSNFAPVSCILKNIVLSWKTVRASCVSDGSVKVSTLSLKCVDL